VLKSNIINPKNITISSFEVHNDYVINSTIDLYVNLNNTIDLPFFGKTYEYNGKTISFKNMFIVSFFSYTISNFDYFLDYFELHKIKKNLYNELHKYKYVEIISLYKKSNNNIAIQWFGLSDNDFIKFLEDNNWPNYFINYLLKNKNTLSHIRKEITINYKIVDNELIIERTSIYGSI